MISARPKQKAKPDIVSDLLLLAGEEMDKENGYEKTQTKPVLWNRPSGSYACSFLGSI